ncbi:MAG: 16S rRNA (uracil(1498)-N(3))-methyltransferase [Neisseriaceae bacterium]
MVNLPIKRLHRFYTTYPLEINCTVVLPLSTAVHLRALRIAVGQTIQLFNGDGFNYDAMLTAVEKKSATVQVISKQLAVTESPLKISLLQCFSTSTKMDWILQKAVELGVYAFCPLVSERSNVKLGETKTVCKLNRWRQICLSACEQTGRAELPILHPLTDFQTAVSNIDTEIKLILDPNASYPTYSIRDLKQPPALAVLVGPEGGFSKQELQLANDYGFISCTLGPRVLRTETAPLAALSSLQALYGDF